MRARSHVFGEQEGEGEAGEWGTAEATVPARRHAAAPPPRDGRLLFKVNALKAVVEACLGVHGHGFRGFEPCLG